jgi:hypothetical protein
MKHFLVKVRGVCDINPNAPGMIAALKFGVEIITTDFTNPCKLVSVKSGIRVKNLFFDSKLVLG